MREILENSTYNKNCMQTSARRVISQEAAKTDDSLYESDSDSEKLTVDLTH